MIKDKNKKISHFANKVYEITSKIKAGQVATYGQIAQAIKKPRATRAVGQALHHNPFAPQVPCHRVIRSNGELGGFAGGSAKKANLLKQEGIKMQNGKINLKTYQSRIIK